MLTDMPKIMHRTNPIDLDKTTRMHNCLQDLGIGDTA